MSRRTISAERKAKAVGEVLAGVDRLTTVADRYDISPSHLSREVSKIRKKYDHGKKDDSSATGPNLLEKSKIEMLQEIFLELESLHEQRKALYAKIKNICGVGNQ